MTLACGCIPSNVPDRSARYNHHPDCPPLEIGGHGETLLIVDDEELILTVASRALSRMGYSILTAKGGKEAIEVVQTYPGRIDLVVLDVDMQPVSGVDAFPYLREAQPDMRILICSGFGRDAAVRRLMDIGADAYLGKPYVIEELAQCIRGTIGSPMS